MNDLSTAQGGVVATGSFVPTREQIEAFERELAAHPNRVDESYCPIRHIFAPGVYAREMTIPAGTFLTGKAHKTRHINVMSAGEITVWTEQGMQRIRAPYTFVSEPGTKRVGFAHEDTVWTTFHVTNETDLAKIEAEVIEPSDNLLGHEPVGQIGKGEL